MFSTVLIANRGAIAVRIIRTLKRMGIRSIAVYSEADIDSLHVTLADESYSLGEGAAAATYLDQQKIIAIAKQTGVDAIHPGYGFLSENSEFVQCCEDAGITFIGPTPEQMQVFGLKHSARELALRNQVPLLPGTDLLNDVASAVEAAKKIGYPVILKSTAGGGGIGMQMCHDQPQLEKAFESVKRLSANNFSNDGLFLEKYIERARHIEVQVFGDGKGNIITLGERDCSAQRRHQKVIEETPAPNLDTTTRKALSEVARQLMAAVKYRNAGTVEFIFDDQENAFYFLEVNTRLQVEHGVTEEVYGVDLVEWMLKQAAGDSKDIFEKTDAYQPKGHAIQLRVYAENPDKNFQPSAGLLGFVQWPSNLENNTEGKLRIDHWVTTGCEVPALFDPMLGKIIVHATDRTTAIEQLKTAIKETDIQGVATNLDYASAILNTREFQDGRVHTRYLNDFTHHALSIDVMSAGTQTTIQDYPGREGYWDVGVPPSGPFDSLSFRLGNRLLGNSEKAPGLEITLNGPTLKFHLSTEVVITGAQIKAAINEQPIKNYQIYSIQPGDVLSLGKVGLHGARSYLLVKNGLQGNNYLGSCSTFTLGQFGGFSGRALRTGDVLKLEGGEKNPETSSTREVHRLIEDQQPTLDNNWQLRVLYGPHGAPDFFKPSDIDNFFSAEWEVHYNSSRTGVRLIGPKPEWARDTGGEAGMHPSNIHDNAYAIGAVDFTGDMPVILGPDGPSLGGFVCPVTVIHADLWKLGQLKAGDKIRFELVDQAHAKIIADEQLRRLKTLEKPLTRQPQSITHQQLNPIVNTLPEKNGAPKIVYRQAGDRYLLVEYGEMVLDIQLRFRVHALLLYLRKLIDKQSIAGVLEMTPGIRSLQIHYDNQQLPLDDLLQLLSDAEDKLDEDQVTTVPSRIVHIPLSWNDPACQLAVDKYIQSVRKDAPWCPDNIEFIRRINGLDSIEDVKRIVFDAHYLVMGLGDVYLGAPVATPLDPRHRLVTTKYNPARTWTAENSVGIGGSYLCVYGMEGPGGYQFVGRTLQMWNRYQQTKEFQKPWLLRFFDQIKFYEVSEEELTTIRRDFPRGRYPLRIEETTFSLENYQSFLSANAASIDQFQSVRQKAFDEELQRWRETGQINFSAANDATMTASDDISDDQPTIESPAAGSIWQWRVKEGDAVTEGQVVCVLESMKMEIEVTAIQNGKVAKCLRQQGESVHAGQAILLLED